jgi:hypothetical protein
LSNFTALRVLAVDTASRIVVAKRFEHVLDVWSRDGERLFQVAGPRLNSHEVRQGAYNMDDNPLANEVLALHVDRSNRLWVLLRRVRDDWRQHVEETTLAGGLRGVRIKDGMADSVYFSRIEVVDLSRQSIVAEANVDALLSGFLNTGDVFGNVVTGDQVPQIQVFRLEWKGH